MYYQPLSDRSHAGQFKRLGKGLIARSVAFVDQDILLNSISIETSALVETINTIIKDVNKPLVLCLDKDPINVKNFSKILSEHFHPKQWFILSNDFGAPIEYGVAPWPFFLANCQLNIDYQKHIEKKYRLGFLSGVPRYHRLLLWQTIKEHISDRDIVVVNKFSHNHFYNTIPKSLLTDNGIPTEITNWLNDLPWSNRSDLIDSDQTKTNAHLPDYNNHLAYSAFCNVTAETSDDQGPLFFTEKTWKSYQSGCLTINYGPKDAPKWLRSIGFEICHDDGNESNAYKAEHIKMMLMDPGYIESQYHYYKSSIDYNRELVHSYNLLKSITQPTFDALENWLN